MLGIETATMCLILPILLSIIVAYLLVSRKKALPRVTGKKPRTKPANIVEGYISNDREVWFWGFIFLACLFLFFWTAVPECGGCSMTEVESYDLDLFGVEIWSIPNVLGDTVAQAEYGACIAQDTICWTSSAVLIAWKYILVVIGVISLVIAVRTRTD